MKKLAIAAVVAAAFGFTSCKKDYTCTCKFSSGATTKSEIKKASKKDAEDTCDAVETTNKQGDPGVSCSI